MKRSLSLILLLGGLLGGLLGLFGQAAAFAIGPNFTSAAEAA